MATTSVHASVDVACRQTKLLKRSPQAAVVTVYLVSYNVVLALGWSWVGFKTLVHFAQRGTHAGLYETVHVPLKVFQTAAVLEVAHCAAGLVKSNVALTAAQVYSRVFLLWGVVASVPQTQNGVGVPMFLVAWTVTEVVRYSFYWMSLLGMLPYIVQWCRYSFFILLYPLGVTGELLSIVAALPHLKTSRMYSVELPNAANLSFSFYYYVIAVSCSYLPVFPRLYGHMLGQRKKIISDEKLKRG